VIEEIGASGGYYIAAAADNIYVDKASIVGSIGVLLSNYGVQDTLKMLGIERRTHIGDQLNAAIDVALDDLLDDRTADDDAVRLFARARRSLGRTDTKADGKRYIRIAARLLADAAGRLPLSSVRRRTMNAITMMSPSVATMRQSAEKMRVRRSA